MAEKLQKMPFRMPGGGFQRVKALKCFPEMREKLLAGWPLPKLADFVQKEQNEYTDVTKQSLVSILHRFRKTIPAGELASQVLPTAITDAVKEVVDSLDEIKALEDLYKLQMQRVQIDFSTEKKIGKLLGSLTQDIRTTREILESIAKLKSDKGITPRNLGTMTHEVQGGIIHADLPNASAAKVLEDPQSRNKVLSLMQKFMNNSSKIDTTAVVQAAAQLPQASEQTLDMSADELLEETEASGEDSGNQAQ